MESTPAVVMPYQAKSGLEFVLDQGVDNLRKNCLEQLKVLHTVFNSHGLDLYLPEQLTQFGAFVLFPSQSASDLACELAKLGVVVDARAGCLRFGPDLLNTEEEFQFAARSLKSLRV